MHFPESIDDIDINFCIHFVSRSLNRSDYLFFHFIPIAPYEKESTFLLTLIDGNGSFFTIVYLVFNNNVLVCRKMKP